MAPKTKASSQTRAGSQKRTTSTRPRTVNLMQPDGFSATPPLKMMRMDPLKFSQSLSQQPSTKVPTPPLSSSKAGSTSQTVHMPSLKGKGKAKELDDSLWVDKYEPTTEAQLAVHVRKVEDVRRWLNEAFEGGPSGKLTKYRRILALTGPAGTGKTTTIKVLAKEMDFEILEWRNAIAETLSDFNEDSSLDYEGMFYKFETFLTRASSCQNIFAQSSSQARRRRIILLEDIPNILHPRTQAQFHEALNSLVLSHPSDPPVPIVIIVSDAGIRGEAGDERRADGGGWGRDKSQVVDIRTVLSKDLLGGPYVTEISFNPIAPTLLRKALQAMLNVHFSSKNRNSAKLPSKDVLDAIVDSANGDIRSAIMALQFACVMDISGKKKKNGQGGSAAVLGAVTRREQSLALFHLLGKVLYNKRKGDPPAASASAKDLQKERDLDAALKDSTKLPSHLLHHERRTSRVDVDALYADSPIESSLFSLYIHQNYTQFCNEMEEVEGVSDWLSWVDSSGGEMWYQANPHQFHLVTLGTLHSLPSPVPRRSQKQYKPEFFAFLQKEKDAWEGVRATRDWLVENEVSQERPGWRPGGWTKNEVILELGGVLKAREATRDRDPKTKPPALHKSFSRMEFSRAQSSVRSQQLDEKDVETNGDVDCDLDMLAPSNKEEKGSWLESDDIEEF